jgi:hypothetical protein
MSFRNPVTTLPASAITGSLPADQVGTGNFTGTYNIVGAFTTGGTGARVDINPNGIFAYNAVGGQTVNISALNGSVSISGTFTIATAVSGTRMVIDNTGINAFNGATNTFNLDAATGSVSIIGTLATGTSGARATVTGAVFTVFSGVAGEVTGSTFDAASSTWLRLKSSTDAINVTTAEVRLISKPALGEIDLIGTVLATTVETSGYLATNGGLQVNAGGAAITGNLTVSGTIGNVASGNGTSSATANTTVTFPASRFTATPQVIAVSRSNVFSATRGVWAYVGNESPTSFTVFCTAETSGGNVIAAVVSAFGWIAVNG